MAPSIINENVLKCGVPLGTSNIKVSSHTGANPVNLLALLSKIDRFRAIGRINGLPYKNSDII